MTHSLGAAALAASLAVLPFAASSATFQFTLEFRFEVVAENFVGDDITQLDITDDADLPSSFGTASGSGEVELEAGLGGRNLTPVSGQPLLGIYRLTGTGMTSPLARGSADFLIGGSGENAPPPFRQDFSLFSFAGDAFVPVDVFWTIAVEASGGEWGDSEVELDFSIIGQSSGPIRLTASSLSGDGRSETSGDFNFSRTAVRSGTSAFSFEVTARGSAQTTAPIPLPAAGWLLLSGLGVLALARRRRG